jgi:hypothetical protein
MPCRTVVLVSALLAGTACDRAPSTALLPPAASSDATAPSPSVSAPVLALSSATAPAALLAQAPVASSPSASAPHPAPHVRVENIGMHIGGGPNDAAHKAPIAESVAPHLDEVRACWTQAADPTRGGDFGVDLLIPREGGKATVSHPRTSIHPDAFRDCVVAVFGQVDFRAPARGRTTVSYSLRFTP